MRALVVDDEIHAREELASLLREAGAFEVLGTCPDAVTALQAIRAGRLRAGVKKKASRPVR